MKKTLSLLLAVVMMLSVLIIPAAAAMPEENVVEPCAPVMDCPKCRSAAQYTDYGIITPSNSQTHFTVQVGQANCKRVSGAHNHWVNYAHKYVVNCSYCGGFTYYDFRGCTYHYCVPSGTLIV